LDQKQPIKLSKNLIIHQVTELHREYCESWASDHDNDKYISSPGIPAGAENYEVERVFDLRTDMDLEPGYYHIELGVWGEGEPGDLEDKYDSVILDNAIELIDDKVELEVIITGSGFVKINDLLTISNRIITLVLELVMYLRMTSLELVFTPRGMKR